MRPATPTVKIAGLNISQTTEFSIGDAVKWFLELAPKLTPEMSDLALAIAGYKSVDAGKLDAISRTEAVAVAALRLVGMKHALSNALIPITTVVGIIVSLLVSGSVVTETLFSIPGMGQLLIAGIYAGDYSLVLGVTTIAIISVATAMFLIDILYPLIDPRVKLG